VHDEHECVLERQLRVLDLVVDDATVLIADTTPVVVFVLAAVAGFSQLFSP
jgi:hypothetical protein